MLKGWDGWRRREVGRWLGEKAPHGRVFDRTGERGHERRADAAMRPRRGVESEHHLVNSRLLFPSALAPIGLRDHSGRSSSSSYFIRTYIRSASSDPLAFSVHVIAAGVQSCTRCIAPSYASLPLPLVCPLGESTGRRTVRNTHGRSRGLILSWTVSTIPFLFFFFIGPAKRQQARNVFLTRTRFLPLRREERRS